MSSRDSSESSGGSASEDKEKNHTPANDLVVTKYNMAAAVVNAVLQLICEKCIAGQPIRELCEMGDSEIINRTNKVG